MDRPETIEDTAELVTAAGGEGVAARCDHADADDVAALVGCIRSEPERHDILVNDVWAGIRSSGGASRCGNTRSTRPSASCATASRRT
jgi:NAD(P)-dependent dehydrogenase (short-subunit alcohol dehydrogenase family)